MKKIKEQDFLDAGFKEERDVMFRFRFDLVSKEQIEINELQEDEVPALLFGSTGLNAGFCIYTGENYMFFHADTPQEATDFASKIMSFESL